MPHNATLLIRDVIQASPQDSILEAARKMRKGNVGCVVVTEGPRPVGIFTEKDLVRVAAEGTDIQKTPVSKAMTPRPVTIESSEALDKVFSVLAEKRFRHLPITEGGKLVGIVSLSDLASVLKQVYKEDRYIQYFVKYMQEEVSSKT